MCQTTMSGGIDDMDEISSSTSSNKKVEKLIEPRKIRKPLMEKKRRARINQSLDELKRIVVDAQKIAGKDLSRVNKLEKADILEMTVRYLKRKATPHADVYAAGYRQCMEQVQELIAEQWTDERRQRSGRRMVEHLETCARRLQKTPPPPPPMDNCRLSSVSSANRFSAGQPCDTPARNNNSCSSSSSASCSSSDDDCCSVSESSSELHRLSPANAAADRTTELQNTAPLKPTWRPW